MQAFGSPTGEFTVEACTPSVSDANHSWTFSTNDPSNIESHSACGEPPLAGNPPTLANLSLGETLGALGVPVGTAGRLRFKAPVGTTIREVSGDDVLMKVGGNMGWNVYLESEDTEGHTHVEQTCATSATENECAVAGPFSVPGLHANAITIGAECNAEEYEPGHTYTTCARGNEFGHAIRAGFNTVAVTLADPFPPTNVTASGIPLGPQHGTITIAGSATDPVAGLVSLSVSDNTGTVVGGPVSVAATCNYSLPTPCPTAVSDVKLPLNTEALPDGEDQVRVLATNAAHEEAASSVYTLTVANHQPTVSGGAGGLSHNETASNPPGTANATTPPPPLSDDTGQGSREHRRLQIRLAKPHLRHDILVLGGTTPTDAIGTMRCTLRGQFGDGRRWFRTTQISLTRGRFSCKIRLGRSLVRGHLSFEIAYSGSASYQPVLLRRKL